jgi:tRNA G46 methylase TrmB
MNIEFDFSKCPKDPAVEVYHPDGTVLVRTDDEKLFLYICTVIKEKQAEGYTVVMADEMDEYLNEKARGNTEAKEPEKMEITKFGRVRHPHPKFFKTYGNFLRELI